MSEPGYYRFPTIHQETLVFICEDDLWTVPACGGVARRLTSNPGMALHPALSPDGALLAFTGRDEGHPEVYIMPSAGGPARRLTFLGADTAVAGWSPDGREVLFSSDAGQPFQRSQRIFAVPVEGGEPRLVPVGQAISIAYGPAGGVAIGRNLRDIARWKRYRGGQTGDLWVRPGDHDDWRRLIRLDGNLVQPLWVGERIYFVSDHEGMGNLYSCLPDGSDLRRHTDQREYYVRQPSTDGRRIVYVAGADLHLFDPQHETSTLVQIELRSPRTQRKRRFVDAVRYLQGYALHPEGQSLLVTVRGKPVTLGCWDGAAVQHGVPDGVRYRLACWLADGRRIAAVSDAGGEEAIEVFTLDPGGPVDRLDGLDIGRPVKLVPAPKGNLLAIANHRNELLVVDVDARQVRTIDRSAYDRINGLAWSPDARWLAYGFPATRQTMHIRLCRIETGQVTAVTRPVLCDYAPAFDPDGKYLYFLSQRDFDPVYDDVHFDLGFPRGGRPYLVTLRADLPSPFVPRSPGDARPASERPEGAGAAEKREGEERAEGGDARDQDNGGLRIDLDGITDRIVAFPVPLGQYGAVHGLRGKVLCSSYPVEGSLSADGAPRGKIEVYDFEEHSWETLLDGINEYGLSADARMLIYRAGWRLRVVKAGERPRDNTPTPGRKTGWIDLGRVRVSISPPAEWCQMYREVWRLQRDQFWTQDMSGVDWQAVYDRYLPLLDRVASRAEFSDLIGEMQGELGTSHAYEYGGDYRPGPSYMQGFLGADLRWDAEAEAYVIDQVIVGDVWDPAASSPLARPGIDIRAGDRLLAVNGRLVDRELPPQAVLVNQAGCDVLLTVMRSPGEQRSVTVRTLRDERPARYRAWVAENRRRVHEATGGKVGYVHIPDMHAHGYAEFHRGFLAEIDRVGLVVDVRFNAGGNVSPLLLEKLARRRLGYKIGRWREPLPYPHESLLGPMVALINEHTASDGDTFSHMFKLLKLGPLIGRRTWGGVIYIIPRNFLVDGATATQPELHFWFNDVGWDVENYGAVPDIEVLDQPQDYVVGRDAQLERGIAEILRLLEASPPQLPDFSVRPRRPLPGSAH